jgi:hypothetical protein
MANSFIRSAHGAAKAAGATVEVSVPPADELSEPSATASLTVRPDRTPNGRFTAKNTVARSRRLRPGKLGGVDVSSPEFRPFAKWGRRYAAHRRDELARAHGGQISAGVGALVESASLALAASRFAHAKASATGDVAMFKMATLLGCDARQHELSAWELASRESKVRGEAKPAWMTALDAELAELEEKEKSDAQ